MKTLSYVMAEIEEITRGEVYYFGQLWDGNGDEGVGEELLEDGAIAIDDENIVTFEIVKKEDDILKTLVRVV